MSSAAVPAAVPTLLRAIEARDLDAIQACFTADAAIDDEGETVHGRAGVDRWSARVLGYAPTFTIEGVFADGGETVVTTTTAGNFPGSPLTFHWHVVLAGDRIAALRIAL